MINIVGCFKCLWIRGELYDFIMSVLRIVFMEGVCCIVVCLFFVFLGLVF